MSAYAGYRFLKSSASSLNSFGCARLSSVRRFFSAGLAASFVSNTVRMSASFWKSANFLLKIFVLSVCVSCFGLLSRSFKASLKKALRFSISALPRSRRCSSPSAK